MSKVVSLTQHPKILVKNIRCLISMKAEKNNELGTHNQCDILIENGKIKSVAPQIKEANAHIIDAKNLTVMPGLIDAHTHPIYASSRAKETVLKAKGATYEEVAQAGGGIRSSMNAVRKASDEELLQNFLSNAKNALERGVVVLESKTGYGLNVEQESKLFSLLHKTKADHLLPWISPTLLPLHAASPDFENLDDYTRACIKNISAWKNLHESERHRKTLPAAADIFIEKNYFTKEQGRAWCTAALENNFNIHLHADEFSSCGGADLAIELAQKYNSEAEMGSILSVDHGQYITELQLKNLAQQKVSAIALPLTSFFSKIAYIDAKMWERSGVNIAIASDFNPGSAPLNSLWMACFLGLTQCGFSLPTCLKSVTLNAAKAMAIDSQFGSIEEGKNACLIGFQGDSPDEFFASPVGDHLDFVLV